MTIIPHTHKKASVGTVQLTKDGPSEALVSFRDGDDEHFFELTRSELERLKAAIEKELRGS